MARLSPQSILITGASSGIGAALALAHAGPGIRLVLTGRDGARLNAVAAQSREQGAEVVDRIVDVANRHAMGTLIGNLDAARPFDLVYANAGIGPSTTEGGGRADDDAVIRRVFAVNLDGVLNTVLPVAALMKARRRGQIALMSSLAAYTPLPGIAGYAATKAAVKSFGEGLRAELRPHGVGVTVICPGYVRSRLTANGPKIMPFVLEADAAANLIARRLARDPAIIAFPWPLHLVTWMIGALPAALRQPLLGLAVPKD